MASITLNIVWYIVVQPVLNLTEFLLWAFLFIFLSSLGIFLIIDRSHAKFHEILGYGLVAIVTNFWIIFNYKSECCQLTSQILSAIDVVVCLFIIHFSYKGIMAKI